MKGNLGRLIRKRLRPTPPRIAGGIWLQAVSVGEVEIAATFVREIHRAEPPIPLLVTSTTPAGVGLLGKRFPLSTTDPTQTAPFPVDLPGPIRRFLDIALPGLLILVETEIWPTLLREAGRRSLPVLLINARLSERSAAWFRRLRPIFQGPLAAITHVAARTAADRLRFLEAGIPAERVTVEGDLKFDRAESSEPAFADEVRTLAGGRPILVAGSLADEEVPLLLDLMRRLRSTEQPLFVLLAPRRPESFDLVAEQVREAGVPFVRRSTPGTGQAADLFLLDSIGELGSAYHLGNAALLGGTFAPRGGHNVLEPLAAGLPVVHGPSISSIRTTLESCPEATFLAEDASSLEQVTSRVLADPALRAQASAAGRSLFESNRGATARVVRLARTLLQE